MFISGCGYTGTGFWMYDFEGDTSNQVHTPSAGGWSQRIRVRDIGGGWILESSCVRSTRTWHTNQRGCFTNAVIVVVSLLINRTINTTRII